MKVHVLLRKEDLAQERLADKVVVVLDILFATSTIVAALAAGARAVLPCADGDAARQAAASLAHDEHLLAGELNAETLPGFLHPMPQSVVAAGPSGKTLVYATTNGTVALAQAASARAVYAGALLNSTAIARHVVAHHPGATVLVVCSGSAGRVNLEDTYGAGVLVAALRRELASRPAVVDFSDAALAVELGYRAASPAEALRASRVGVMMLNRGLGHEVAFAAQVDHHPVVPLRQPDGWLRLVS